MYWTIEKTQLTEYYNLQNGEEVAKSTQEAYEKIAFWKIQFIYAAASHKWSE